MDREFEIPVIDGVVAVVKFLRVLYDRGTKISKICTFRRSEKKFF